MASTVETELAKPRSALPDSIALTLAIPAPGRICMVVPDMFCSTTFLIAPPSGYQDPPWGPVRSEEHTSELQSLMRISYAVFCLKKKKLPLTQHLISSTHSNTTHTKQPTESKPKYNKR